MNDLEVISNLMHLIPMQYNSLHRHYHNLNHPCRMFEIAAFECIKLSISQCRAIWLHDYIYDTPAKELSNEERSAQFCELVYPDDEVAATIIRDTEKHIPSIEESEVIIDLDLWDLSDVERSATNAHLIRKEFSYLTDEQWLDGRIKWIESFLAREKIFVSEYSMVYMEEQARLNLERELVSLRAKRFMKDV